MVPNTLKPLCQGTSAATPRKINTDKSKKYCPSIDGGELISTRGLVASGKSFRVTESQEMLLTLSQVPDEKAHSVIMSQPGEKVLAGV